MELGKEREKWENKEREIERERAITKWGIQIKVKKSV